MASRLTEFERDLLNHLVTGAQTHSNGHPMAYGAWMTACLEALEGYGYVERSADQSGIRYAPTDTGRTALEKRDE